MQKPCFGESRCRWYRRSWVGLENGGTPTRSRIIKSFSWKSSFHLLVTVVCTRVATVNLEKRQDPGGRDQAYLSNSVPTVGTGVHESFKASFNVVKRLREKKDTGQGGGDSIMNQERQN